MHSFNLICVRNLAKTNSSAETFCDSTAGFYSLCMTTDGALKTTAESIWMTEESFACNATRTTFAAFVPRFSPCSLQIALSALILYWPTSTLLAKTQRLCWPRMT